MEELQEVHLSITGDVQGVTFRYFLVQCAVALNLKGFVRNENDGSVTAVAQGRSKLALEEFIEAAKRGPYYARVDRVDTGLGKAKEPYFTSFEMRY